MTRLASAIPGLTQLDDKTREVVAPIKEGLEIIQGRRPGLSPIESLSVDATLADVIAKVNELLDRMQS